MPMVNTIDLTPERFKNHITKSSVSIDAFDLSPFDLILMPFDFGKIQLSNIGEYLTPSDCPPIPVKRFGIPLYPVETSKINNYILNSLPADPLQAKEKLKTIFPNVPEGSINDILTELLNIKKLINVRSTKNIDPSLNEKLTSLIDNLINAEILNDKRIAPTAGYEILAYNERYRAPQYRYIPSTVGLLNQLGYNVVPMGDIPVLLNDPGGIERVQPVKLLGGNEWLLPVSSREAYHTKTRQREPLFKVLQTTGSVKESEKNIYGITLKLNLSQFFAQRYGDTEVKISRVFRVDPIIDSYDLGRFGETLTEQGWSDIQAVEYSFTRPFHATRWNLGDFGRYLYRERRFKEYLEWLAENVKNIPIEEIKGSRSMFKYMYPTSMAGQLGLETTPGNFIVFNTRITVGKDKKTIDASIDHDPIFFFKKGFLPQDPKLAESVISDYVERRLVDLNPERLQKLEEMFKVQLQNQLRDMGLKIEESSIQRAAKELRNQFVIRSEVLKSNIRTFGGRRR